MSWLGVEAVFWTLCHSLWQGGLIHALVLQVRRRTRSPHERYALLLGAQAALLGATAVTYYGEVTSLPVTEVVKLSAIPLLPNAGQAMSVVGQSRFFDFRLLMAVVVGIWLAGLVAFAARGATGWFALRRLRRQAVLLTSWQERVNGFATRLQLRGPVIIAESRGVSTPLVLGWLKPLVLFPCGWVTSLAPDVVEAAILHELVHIRRWDFLVNALQLGAESVLYYHPSMRFFAREVREERESCCDDIVSRHWVDPLNYACALLALEQQRNQATVLPNPGVCVAATDGHLMKRIDQITRVTVANRPQAIAGGLASSLLLATASLSFWALSCTATPAASEVAPANPDSVLQIAWMPPAIQSYSPNIEAAASRHGVAADLLAVIAFVESRGDAKAESPGGAVGLMQLMPATAAVIAKRRGHASPTSAKLMDVDYNLDLAAYLLAEQFRNVAAHPKAEQVRLVAIAYNGGSQTLQEHLETGKPLNPETNHYQQLVSSLWQERGAPESETLAQLAHR